MPWWELDISQARPLIESMTPGGPTPTELLTGIIVRDVSAMAAHLVGPFGGRERMVGRSIADFWPAESHGILVALFTALIRDRPAHAPQSRAITSLMIRDATLTLRMKDGQPDIVCVEVAGVVFDERSRWSLRASEERYRRLIHHLPIALLQLDASAAGKIFDRLKSEGVTDLGAYLDEYPEMVGEVKRVVRVTDVNHNAELLLGGDRGDCIGPVDYLFTATPDTARRLMIGHFEERRSYAEVLKIRTFDGRLLDVRLTVTYPTPPERADITLITLEDLTDQLRTEAQLRQVQADFSRAGRIATLGELATSIAHEVSQPLSAIVTNAETSLRWLTRDDPNLAKAEQLTTRIAESARHANEIVQRIRGMASRHAPERAFLDINEVIDEALLFIRHDVESRSIDLSVELAPGMTRLVGDRVQLQQVFVNLLLNSIQAIAQDNGVPRRIELRTQADGGDALSITIRDSGPGIDAEHIDRVFEGFFTTKDDGIGIGLAICHSIIAAHGGRISASNHRDGGAVFEIRLPAPSPAQPAERSAVPQPPSLGL